jgi:hypothetical protein
MIRKLILIFSVGFLMTVPAFAQGVDTLTVMKVTSPPVVDGVVDDVWNDAQGLTVMLGETYDVNDPASIMDCAGCHSFNSNITVTLKAVYTTDHVYFLATWPDSTASFTRGGSWSFAGGSWEKPNSDQSEDRISFLWPMGTIVGDPYNTGGCMAKCHTYWPTDNDPHVSDHGIVDDAWLESGRADMWHSKAARGGAYLGASGSNLTIDPVTHQVIGGTFSMLGFADDKYVDVWAPDSINGEDGGRYGDAGTSAYSHNRISDHSRPKYMETNPIDFADAMFLTQDEIDGAECVGNATTGVSDADAATYWPAYEALDAVVPERILRMPTDSRADLNFGSVWSNGTWTAEIGRVLHSGNDDDVQFDEQSTYLFGVAVFDNSRHGYQHRTSQMYSLVFSGGTGIEEGSAGLPHSFALSQNYPNPFNPSTMVSFDMAERSLVQLCIYDLRGRKVKTLKEGVVGPGHYQLSWDGKDDRGIGMPSGVYIYRLVSGRHVSTRKMLLLK